VSGQFNGTVARHLSFDVFVDLATLKDYPFADKGKPTCADEKSGITGDLRINEALETGIKLMDTSSPYNVYGSSGPKAALDQLVNATQKLNAATASPVIDPDTIQRALSQQLSSLNSLRAFTPPQSQSLDKALNDTQRSLLNIQAVAPRTGTSSTNLQVAADSVSAAATTVQSNSASKSPSTGGTGGNTSFGTEIDFTIVENIGGGPGFAKTHWKIGAGGGGGGSGGAGGGGGGGGAGGGGGSGAGGGGGGNLYSRNHTNVDSIQLQVAMTCIDESGYRPASDPPRNYWDTIGVCKDVTRGDIKGALMNKNYQERLDSLLPGARR
jgi:hypothetical protein